MIEFFKSQMDYIFFVYGIGFFVLAAICFLLIKTQNKRLAWLWLGLFASIHAVNEWMDMFALSMGDSSFFKGLRLFVLTLSFLFLFEFVRVSFYLLKGIKVRRWIYVLFALLQWQE